MTQNNIDMLEIDPISAITLIKQISATEHCSPCSTLNFAMPSQCPKCMAINFLNQKKKEYANITKSFIS